MCSIAIVWANLAYLLVTMPLLVARLRRADRAFVAFSGHSDASTAGSAKDQRAARRYFSLGVWGLPVNAIAVVWGAFVIINISWPRAEFYGSGAWSRFAAPLATLGLLVSGIVYFLLFQGRRSGTLAEHAFGVILEPKSTAPGDPPVERRWIGRLARGD
jgi:hypothetical protein